MTRSSIWDVDRDRYADDVVPLRLWPAGVCCSCRRFLGCMISDTATCAYCGTGVVTHRANWLVSWCPTCDGRDAFCGTCHGKRVIAIPIPPEPAIG